MRVSLYTPYKEEQWVSSQVFAKRLRSALALLGVEARLLSPGERWFSSLLRYSKVRFFLRTFVYPCLAFVDQRDVNHILDSSYSQAAIFLDRRSTIITCHDLIPLKLFRERRPNWKEWVKLGFYRWGLRYLAQARAVVAVSASTKQDLVELLGIPDERIRVIYQGVGEEFRRPPQSELSRIRKRYRLPRRFILHIGHNYYYKNVELFLHLLRRLGEDRATADVRLVKVGPAFLPEQQRLIERLGLAGRIKRLEDVPTPDLVGIYSLATLLVQPSTFEGFGLTVLEAMACGCPVLASDIPPFRELYGGAAELVPPTEPESFLAACRKLLGDRTARHSLSRRGIERSKDFSWQATAAAYASLYRTVRRTNVGVGRLASAGRLWLAGGFWALWFGALAKLLGFAWRLLAASLGPAAFGVFSIAASYIETLGSLSVLGLPVAVVRFAAYYQVQSNRRKLVAMARTALWLATLAGVGLFLVVISLGSPWLVAILRRPEVGPPFTILAFSLPFIAPAEVLLALINAAGLPRRFFLAKRVVPAILRFIVLALLFLIGLRLSESIAASLVVFSVSTVLISWLIVRRFLPELGRLGSLSLQTEFFRFLAPVSAAHVLQSLTRSLDVILLSLLLPPAEIGIYSAAYIFLPLVVTIPEAFLEFFSASFSRVMTDRRAWFSFFLISERLLLLMSLPFLALLILGGSLLVRFVLPAGYSQTATLVAILGVAHFLRTLLVFPARKVIDSLGRTDLTFWLTAAEILLQIGLGIAFIRAFGILGAGLMLLVVFSFSTFSTLLVIRSLYSGRIAYPLPHP